MIDSDLPVFPQEIFDQIIEHARTDREVLLATSLVCRDWVQTSRRYLFESIILRPTTLKGFSTLCCPTSSARPTFLHHIRNIVFERSRSSTANYFSMPAPSVYLDRDLLGWLPVFKAVKNISIWSIEWESTEILHRFSSLFPNATSLTLRADALNKLSNSLTLICAFPTLQSVYWSGGVTDTLNHAPLIALPDLPRNRVLPSLLTTLSFDLDSFSRDALIRSIPLGDLRLQTFEVYVCTSESLSCLHNVILFMEHHCLDVSVLSIVFHDTNDRYEDEWTDYWSFRTKLEEFLDLFGKFRSLKHLMLSIRTDWDDVRIPPWVYEALALLRPELMIESLLFGLQGPADERDEKKVKEYIDSCVDWKALNEALALRQFRELNYPCFQFHW